MSKDKGASNCTLFYLKTVTILNKNRIINKNKNKMKAQSYTEIVRNSNSLKLMKFIDYIPALIANIFSVIFSTSIILELKGIVNGYVLILLSVFIILFLIQNEIIKVKEIRRVFSSSRNALLPFAVTFILSISLATIGMYFYTNKASEIKDVSTINKSADINNIELKYQLQYNEIQNKSFESTKEFENINSNLKYWKHANAIDIAERAEIRKRVENLQNVLIENRTKFENNKSEQIKRITELINNEKNVVGAKFESNMNKTQTNNFISYIFLTLILITEFSTIVLNKNIVEKRNYVNQFTNSKIAKTYLIASNLLTTLYMSAKNNWVNINNAKYSYANKDNLLEWDDIKTIYNNFISLGILTSGEVRKEGERELLYNELVLDEAIAQKKLDEYFERFFKVM